MIVRKPAFILVAVLGCASARAATSWAVDVGPGLAFSPSTLVIRAGDSVRFTNRGGWHNVKADDNSFRCAHGCDGVGSGNGDPSNSIWFFTRTFPTPGTVGYYCELHGDTTSGMRGVIVVEPTPVGLQSFEVE